jgi:hypothetical protein
MLNIEDVCLPAKLTDDKQNGALQIGFITTSVLLLQL